MANRTPDSPRLRLSASFRRALLVAHIIVAVGLLGDSAGFLAIAVRAAVTDDPQLAASSYELLRMFSYVFGIPLSFATLVTGVALGLTSKWGVLRYPWTVAKLSLIVSVILVGALVIDGALDEMLNGVGNAENTLIAAAAWDVLALAAAVVLAVYKPGGRLRADSGSRVRRSSSTKRGDPVDYRQFTKKLRFPEGFTPHPRLTHGDVVATAITRADLADDVHGINISLDLINTTRGGGWPSDPVTDEYNFVDLVWHELEFREGKSLTYVVRGVDRTYLGCCYLYPLGERTQLTEELLGYDVDVSWWVTPAAYEEGYYAKVYDALRAWLDAEFSFWRPYFSNKQLPS